MANKLDLADAQFIGFSQCKMEGNIVRLAEAMGLTRAEWIKWKKLYPQSLDEENINELDAFLPKAWRVGSDKM